MEHEGENYTNHDCCFWYSYQRIIKGTGGLGAREKPSAKTDVKNSQGVNNNNNNTFQTKFKKNISGELENYSRQNFLVETLSKE